MSDMKIFTVRELDRAPSTVLDAADKEGIARIQRRDGRVYCLRPEAAAVRMTRLPDFRSRLKRTFPQPVPASQAVEVDRLIAGE